MDNVDFSKILNEAQKIGMDSNDFMRIWARIKYNGDTNAIPSSEKGPILNTLSSKNKKTDLGEKDKNEKKEISYVELSKNILEAGQRRTYIPSSEESNISVSSLTNALFTDEGNLRTMEDAGSRMVDILKNKMVNYYQQQTGLLSIINEQAGLTGKFARYFREELTNASPRLEQLGIDFNELGTSAKEYIDASGRFATINQQTWERAGEVAKSYVGTLSNLVAMYPEFEKIGIGAADAQERIADAGKRSLSLGLQAQKTTKELQTNLGKLNEYGFKNGVQGLAEMVRKSNEFRMSISSVFTLAEKVMNPEGALDLSANLQAIGGAIGDLNDPLKLMYMSTNNVEGLQDAIKGAASSLAVYNSEQGRFEITGINLRRAKEMAKELGMDLNQLTQGAIAAAERTKAQTELAARGLQLTDDQKRFITNISQMKGGKMTIELNSQELKNAFGRNEIAINELTQEQVERLTKLQDEFKNKTEEEIIRDQATNVENIKRDLNFILGLMMKETGQFTDAAIRSALGLVTDKKISDTTLELSKQARSGLENKGVSLFKELLDNFKNTNNQNTNTPQPPNTTTTSTTTKPPINIQPVRSPDQQSTTLNQNASTTANASVNQPTKKIDLDITKYPDALVTTNIKTEANTLDTSKGVALLNKNMDTIVSYVQTPKVSPPNNNTPIAQVNINANPQTKNIDDKSMANVDVVRKRESEPIVVDKKITIEHKISPINDIVDNVAKAMLRDETYGRSVSSKRDYLTNEV
jgi:hypothetical protein